MYGIKDMIVDVKYAISVVREEWRVIGIKIRRKMLENGHYNFKIRTVK